MGVECLVLNETLDEDRLPLLVDRQADVLVDPRVAEARLGRVYSAPRSAQSALFGVYMTPLSASGTLSTHAHFFTLREES